jgi:hypothetical protein
MTSHEPPPSSPGSPRGLGGLVTHDVERIALGTHAGHELHARVERRAARFTSRHRWFGHQWHLDVDLGRARPVAIEVSAPGERYDLPVTTTDPWWRLVRRISALAIASMALVIVAGRARRSLD